jgi:hypothetical protein
VFGSPVLLDWALPTSYEKGLSALPEREARIELLYSAGPESPEKSPASPCLGSSPTGVSAAPPHFPLLQTLSLLSPRTKRMPAAAAAAHRFDAGHRLHPSSAAGRRRLCPSSAAGRRRRRTPASSAEGSRRRRCRMPASSAALPPLQDDAEAAGRRPPPLQVAAGRRRRCWTPTRDADLVRCRTVFLRCRMPTRDAGLRRYRTPTRAAVAATGRRARLLHSPAPAPASGRPASRTGTRLLLFLLSRTRLRFLFCLGTWLFFSFLFRTRLLFYFLVKGLCTRISILNSRGLPNNFSVQLGSRNPGYQTRQKIWTELS